MQFTAEGISDLAEDEQSMMYRQIASLFSEYSETLWENLKMDSMNEKGLLKSAISGSFVTYWYWYDKIDNGDGQMGNIMGELVNICNYFPGDPNNPEINNAYEPVQPYIILSFRRNVSDVRMEAKENGVSAADIEYIVSDNETSNQAGDRAKDELEGGDGKCTVLLHLWRELKEDFEEVETIDPFTGEVVIEKVSKGKRWHIYAEKSTQTVIIRKKWDTGFHRYPVALMNWYEREGDAYGEAEATSLVPNNILINQQAAMIALWIKLHGFPKVLYDKTRIPNWSNDLSKAIPVNGVDAGGVGGAATYMQPAQISAAVMQFMTWFMTWFISITKDMAGANESALGEANPTNTSAIIVNSKNAVVPLASIKRRFYQYIEDIGLIWLDFWTSKFTEYPVKNLPVKRDGKTVIEQIDTSILKDIKLRLKVDVGPANMWSEAAQAQTLDNLLQQQLISFIEYLERQPKGSIPDIEGLLDARKSEEAAQKAQEKQFLYMLMAKFMEEIEPTLPPEAQNELKMLQRNDPPAYENQVKQLITQQAQQPRPYADNVEGVM